MRAPLTSVTKLLRRTVRRAIGLWPADEIRNKVIRTPGAVRFYRIERREIARLRRETGGRRARVTTVIPTYSRPERLPRAVASALRQDVDDHVVVVVDDGAGLPRLPSDPRLVAVSLAEHTGHSGLVRNIGLGIVDSEYASFLDDDNEWRDNHLRVALAALDDGADLVYTALERYLPDGRLFDVLSQPFERRLLRERSFVDTNGIVVRRTRGVRFSRIRRGRGIKPPVDWEFVWRMSRRMRVVHLPVPTVVYAVHNGSYFSKWPVLENYPLREEAQDRGEQA